MAKHPGGRPTVMTAEAIRKLEIAFLAGATDLEACCYADISKTSLYKYCEENPEFAERKETLKNQPTMKAKLIILNALDDQDLATAHKVIDRKEGSKVNQTISGVDGGPIKTESTWTVLPVTPVNATA